MLRLWKKPSGSSSTGSGGVASPPANLQRLRNAHVASSGGYGGHPHAEVAELRRGYPGDGSGMGSASAMPHGIGMGVGDIYYAGGAVHGDDNSSASGGYAYEGAYANAPVADVAANLLLEVVDCRSTTAASASQPCWLYPSCDWWY